MIPDINPTDIEQEEKQEQRAHTDEVNLEK